MKSLEKSETTDDAPRSFRVEDDSSEHFELGESVYGLMFIAPYSSWHFAYAIVVYLLKMALFYFLGNQVLSRCKDDMESCISKQDEKEVYWARFCLTPVALAIQEDLIYVYTHLYKIKYDKTLVEHEQTKAATLFKFFLSFFLRFTDGFVSLLINFALLLTTSDILAMFLNFAALEFLQGVDDLAFELGAFGYLGDKMDERCAVVKRTVLLKRTSHKWSDSLDTVLFLSTLVCMYVGWLCVYLREEKMSGS